MPINDSSAAAGIVLLFEVGTPPHDGIRKPERCNLYGALSLARRPRAGDYAQSSKPRPRGTSLAEGELGNDCKFDATRQPPRSRRGTSEPPQELSRCAARDEAKRRAVALRPAPAWALAQQPGRAGPPPDQAPDPAHARLSGLLDGEADAGRHRSNGDASQGTSACRAQG